MLDLPGYLVLRVAVAFFAAVPLRVALAIGRALGALAFRVARLRRAVVLANLRHVFGPTKTDADLLEIAAGAYRAFGMTFVEVMRWSSPRRSIAEVRVDFPDGARDAMLAHARGALIPCPAHLGNFDLAAAATFSIGIPHSVVMKPLANARANRFLVEARARHGSRLILTGTGAFKECEARLRAGEWVAMLPDQNARARGVPVDFLGKPATIFKGPAVLHLATGAPIMAAGMIRDPKDYTRHELHVRFLPAHPPTGDEAADVRAVTQALATALGEIIRKDPSQYFWFHRMWGKAVAAGRGEAVAAGAGEGKVGRELREAS